jgi:predicted transcriptional regulator
MALCSTLVLQCFFIIWNEKMPTTTVRLPQDLKQRIARAAERAGTTAHNFILEALTEKTDQAERRAEFMDTAEQRYAQIAASGKTVPWSEMRKHLERRIAGEKSIRPKSRTLAR